MIYLLFFRQLKAGFRRLADIADTNSDSEDSAESGIVLKKDFSNENISSSNSTSSSNSYTLSGFVNLDDFEITKVLGKIFLQPESICLIQPFWSRKSSPSSCHAKPLGGILTSNLDGKTPARDRRFSYKLDLLIQNPASVW